MDSDYISPYLFNLPKEEDNPLDLDWSSLLQDQDQTTCPYGTNNIMTQSNQYFANFSQPQHNIFSNYELMLSHDHHNMVDFYSPLDHFEFSTPAPLLLEVGDNYYHDQMGEETSKTSSCHANGGAITNFVLQNGDDRTDHIHRRVDSGNYKRRRSCCNLEYEEVQKYFDLPISRAAKELKVGLTVLKRRCRELNIMRWPHRKIKSLDSLIKNVQEMGLTEELARLERHKQLLALLPDMELTERTKKLRQACFKANYKKRIIIKGL